MPRLVRHREMPESPQLQIAPAGPERGPVRGQKRLATLVRQLEQAGATLQAWHENLPLYRQAHQDRLVSLQTELHALRRRWVIVLDAAASRRGWSRAEGDTLREALSAAAGALLASDSGDAALRAVFARRAGMAYEDAQRELPRQQRPVAAPVPPPRIEQVDPAPPARVDASGPQPSNQALAEQLAALRARIEGVACGFQAEFGLAAVDPRRLGKLLEEELGRLRSALAQLQAEVTLFADTDATRRWLRDRRRRLWQEGIDRV